MKKSTFVLSEMLTFGEVSESFYDDHGFPLEKDHKGNIWRLKSSAAHMTRSNVLLNSSVIAKKQDDIRISVQAKTSKEIKAFQESKNIFETNKDCEAKLAEAVK